MKLPFRRTGERAPLARTEEALIQVQTSRRAAAAMYTRSLAQCVLCSRLQRECVYQKSPPGEPASVERADGPGGGRRRERV